MSFFNAFVSPSRTSDAWFLTGRTTSFPNITGSGDTVLSDRLPCNGTFAPGCKVFHVPLSNSTQAVEVDLDDAVAIGLKEQVMVFQYHGKFHAVDHVSAIALLCTTDREEDDCEEIPNVSGPE
ncbi:hypothetical protein DSL72_006230 [Monilinia vaccinii-corymbosi]|uniref:Uncharacterized protein n=1 Tax=Monilinia vaccinii-corymbosi TaxID=61207 RepID=A0A8A3PN63_9HELO|nr:hypothetical protein DSL72_006230 [Monilinia vaccinii-corymbosi]